MKKGDRNIMFSVSISSAGFDLQLKFPMLKKYGVYNFVKNQIVAIHILLYLKSEEQIMLHRD